MLMVYQAASRLPRNEKRNVWLFFPITKKWGAVGDTLAELCYLRDQGELKMSIHQGQVT